MAANDYETSSVKVDLVTGVTPVSLVSVEQTARELTELIGKCRSADVRLDPGSLVSAWEVAEIAHQSAAGLLAVVEHPAADPAMLLGVLVATSRLVDPGNANELCEYVEKQSGSDFREVVHSHSPLGYPVVIVERTFDSTQLRAGTLFDCQLQAVVADVARPRVAVFTLSSTTGRGWLELSRVFGRLIASVDFAG